MFQRYDARLEVKEVGQSGIFCGYGSVYDVIDEGNDIVQAGAFTESLANCCAKGQMPAMLWQHRSGEVCGAYTSIKEDHAGLLVEGQLCLDTQRGAEAYALMKMKALNGLSIGFQAREDSYDQKTGVRTIKKGDLWEVSLVTFPMNDQARVSAIKSIDEITDFKSVEAYLRDAGQLSRSEAKALIACIKGLALRDAGAADQEAKQLIAALSHRTALLQH